MWFFIPIKKTLTARVLWQQELCFSQIILLQMLLFFFLRLYHTQRIYIFSIYLKAEIQMIAG